MTTPKNNFSEEEILAYLEESLPLQRTTQLEEALRSSSELQTQIAELLENRDQGSHTVGEIWRRHQLSCPSRSDLGRYLLDAISDDESQYMRFHLEEIACRTCLANLHDLQQKQEEQLLNQPGTSTQRQKRYFESSAGFLKGTEPKRN